MDAQVLDVVKLKDGRTATVVEKYEDGCLVEVSDADGRTTEMPVVRYDRIESVTWRYPGS